MNIDEMVAGCEMDAPNIQRYIKAFRLKNFGRCPCCDAGLRRAENSSTQCYLIRCDACKWNYTIGKLVVIQSSDIDDIYLSIVDAANLLNNPGC